MSRVPTIRDVIPGKLVNIILKADQTTGRTVSGTVATLLTRGNHPRGIKVRLTDGRVGRVQSMVAGGAGNGASSQTTTAPTLPTSRVAASAVEPPSQTIGLDAYITKPRRRGKGGKHANSQQSSGGNEEEQAACSSEAVTCPVCGDFEGDEAAVAHHVSSHFGD
ncbi:hypothetical protein BJX68DRAFT_239245 [Aspergillus pseudodeflectus]|uniref:UBZ4-type domain-containing protein n=1 Tax=Aspergillus pseudodeflectus TaxID=176178 RepID=A0ABR4K6S4_9EURO